MDDSGPRVAPTRSVIPAQAGIQNSLKGLAIMAGLLVLLGAGCAKTSEVQPAATTPVANVNQIVEPISRPAQEPKVYQLSEIIEHPLESPRDSYCSYHVLPLLLAGELIDSGDRKLPELSEAFKTVVKDLATAKFCYFEEEDVVFFTYFTLGQDRGDYRFGFWKAEGFGSKGGEIVFSENSISADGGGDAATIRDVRLSRQPEGYLIMAKTGGGDGPFWWESDLTFDPGTKNIQITRRCDHWAEYSRADGESVQAGSECKDF